MMTNKRKLVLDLAEALWNWKPHASQKQWLTAEGQVKTAACGRRWGKTEAEAYDAACTAILEPGCVQIILSPTYDQSKLIFSKVESLLLGNPATRALVKSVKTPYPRLTIGKSLIMARTVDEDGRNLRGHFADRVIIDEAAYVKDNIVNEVVSPMLADKNGELVMISTPFGKNHFYQAFQRGLSKNSEGYISFTFPSWENPHINREYIEKQKNIISPLQFAVEYEARFMDNTSCVFKWEDIIKAAKNNISNDNAECLGVVCGVDWARYSDYTAFCSVAVYETGLEVLAVERFNNMSWSEQIDRLIEFCSRYGVCSILTDQTSIGDPLLEQLRDKISSENLDIEAEGLTFSNKSKREIVDNLAVMFARENISIPNNDNLIKELQYFEYKLSESGNVKMNARVGEHDDLVMALGLACRKAKNFCGPMSLYSVGAREAF
ncbi:MAG: terminase family protein [Armatimonadota bacterium]